MKKIKNTINNFRSKLNLNVPKEIEVIRTFGDRGNEEKTIKYGILK